MVRKPPLGSSTPRGTVCNTGSFWKNNLTVWGPPASIGSAVRYDIVDCLLPSLIIPLSLPIEYVVVLEPFISLWNTSLSVCCNPFLIHPVGDSGI